MSGESRETGLARELAEELGIRVLSAHPLIRVEHCYPYREVVLDVWRVESFAGEPHGREGQRIEWRDVHELDPAGFPPADVPVLAALRLPSRYLVTPEPRGDWNAFLDRLAMRVAEGFELVQLRVKSLDEPALVDLGRRAAEICRRGGATLLVNADPVTARRCGTGGVHPRRPAPRRLPQGARSAAPPGRSVVPRRAGPRTGAGRGLRLRGPGAGAGHPDPPGRAGARLDRLRGLGAEGRDTGVRDRRIGRRRRRRGPEKRRAGRRRDPGVLGRNLNRPGTHGAFRRGVRAVPARGTLR